MIRKIRYKTTDFIVDNTENSPLVKGKTWLTHTNRWTKLTRKRFFIVILSSTRRSSYSNRLNRKCRREEARRKNAS